MGFVKKTSEKIAGKQKRLYIAIMVSLFLIVIMMVFTSSEEKKEQVNPKKNQFATASQNVKAEDVRLTTLETLSDILNERTQSLEKSVLVLKEEKALLEREKETLLEETGLFKQSIKSLEEQVLAVHQSNGRRGQEPGEDRTAVDERNFYTWEMPPKNEDKNVLFEIPAGTVVKAVLVSGADCTVAVQKPTGPNMVLLRTLDQGKLPKKVKVRLKGSVIVGNAIGDLASERVYVRAERMTLVEPNGDFVETEISAYISGEDGREGMRGVVVDRSGQIMARAFFATFMQGVGDSLEGYLNNQTIEKLAGVSPSKTILNLDMLQSSALQGGSNAFNKFAEYYIKRAEQLQPAIQIAAGRIVDVVFVKTVKIGENDLKKKLDREREIKMREQHG